MYVTTCSQTFSPKPKNCPRLRTALQEKWGPNCEELRDRYTGPPRGNTKELGYPWPEGHGKMCGSRPSHMLENTLFRGLFSNPWHLDQVFQTIVTKSETFPEHISSVHGAGKRDPIALASQCVYDYDLLI